MRAGVGREKHSTSNRMRLLSHSKCYGRAFLIRFDVRACSPVGGFAVRRPRDDRSTSMHACTYVSCICTRCWRVSGERASQCPVRTDRRSGLCSSVKSSTVLNIPTSQGVFGRRTEESSSSLRSLWSTYSYEDDDDATDCCLLFVTDT